MKPMADQIAATQQVRDDNRKNVAQSSHLASVSEGVPAVGWVTVVSVYSVSHLKNGHDVMCVFQKKRLVIGRVSELHLCTGCPKKVYTHL